jgi:transcriptional regulator with XRE-family HTH domain
MAKPSPLYARDKTLVALGAAIREVRKGCKLSQESLAAETGVDRSHMGGIERGENNVSIMTIQKIATILGLTMAELFSLAGI